MLKKILAILIVFSVLLPVLAGCSGGGGDTKPAPPGGDGDAQDVSDRADSTENAAERFVPDVPDMDFGGYEFRAFVPTNNMYASFTFAVEEDTGDTLNDAIFKRNKYIENKYNVVFKQSELEDFWLMTDMFKRSVMSGSDDYDVSSQFYGWNLALQGYTLPADALPHADMTKPWYMHDLNEVYSIGNRCFVAYSDEYMCAYDVRTVLCFNKNLIKDLALENPYDLVKAGAWTHDRFFDMCRAASADIDGDGKMTDRDRYGILSQYDELLSPFWVCSEVKTVVKDLEGMLVLNLAGNERLFSILDKIHLNIYGGEKILFDTHPQSGDKVTSYQADKINISGFIDVSRQQFENNSGLFLTARLVTIPNLRAMDADFGILPYPKADENQQKYYAFAAESWPRVVPSNAPNPERTGIILEALAAESRNTVIPAYKETCLKTKFARDDESLGMLDIIFDNVVVDLGTIVFWESIRNTLIEEARKKGNFVSVVEKQYAKFEKLVNEVNNSVGKSIE